MDVVQSIRENLGLDAPDPTELERMLGRALEHLADQLYRTDTHFVLEFVQNAEDNAYHPDVTPTLSLRIEDYTMTISCNERGFDESNVRALCNIGTSTKKHQQGFIGEKGIGFKSVFKVANVVRVTSGDFRFKFDRDQRLGMIAPIWEDDLLPVYPGWTEFHLELTSLPGQTSTSPGTALSSKLEQIRASLLLFLEKLRCIEVSFALNGPEDPRIITLFRHDVGPDIVKLTHCENDRPLQSDFYLMISYFADMSAIEEPKRQGVNDSEIVLAFPVTEDIEPVFSPQDVHVFLPLRPVGFNFVVQADFLTSSSREDILADSYWNRTLLYGVVSAFIQAIDRFQYESELRDTWFGYLPNIVYDPFFSEIQHHLFYALWGLPIIRDVYGVYRRPQEIIITPPRLRDKNELPLIPSYYLPARYHFISPDYDLSKPSLELSFKQLLVQEMDDDIFLECLGIMSTRGAFPNQSEEWHEAVCDLLYRMPRARGMYFHPLIGNLNILPLANGTWVRANTAPELVFDLEFSGVPDDINLRRISRQVQLSSSRYQFFSALGVKTADLQLIARKILQGSTSNRPNLLVQRARFFFDYRDSSYSLPKPSNLNVISDSSLRLYQGQNIYLDLPQDGGRLREFLPAATPFLHSLYLQQYEGEEQQRWFTWLQDALAINTAPHLISGSLPDDFLHSIKNTAADRFLLGLQYFWPRFKDQISDNGIRQISQAVITLEDKSTHRLDMTFVRRTVFSRLPTPANFTLPFLPIADPDSEGWDFLRLFGVVLEVNTNYFLKLLMWYQKADCRDQHAVSTIYQQLSSRFDESPELIRDTFRQYPLILEPGEGVLGQHWFTRMEAYWDGPPTMVTKFAVRRAYDPSFREFFFGKLEVRNAPYTTLLDELKALVQQWKGRVLTSEVHERVSDMLADLWDLIYDERVDVDDIRRLAGDTIFPVKSRRNDVLLMSLKDFYVPDRDERLAKLFAGRISLLCVGTSRRATVIPKLFNSPALKPHVQYLESSVIHQHEHHGTRRYDPMLTSRYVRRLEFIERLLYHRSTKPSAKQISSLEKMQNMTIHRVDKIISKLTIEDVTITTRDAVSVMDDSSRIDILVSNENLPNTPGSEEDVHMKICGRLSSLLEIEVGRLFQAVITREAGTLFTLYNIEGIAELDHASLFQNRGWLDDSLEGDNDEVLSTPLQPRPAASPATPPPATPSPATPPPATPSPSTPPPATPSPATPHPTSQESEPKPIGRLVVDNRTQPPRKSQDQSGNLREQVGRTASESKPAGFSVIADNEPQPIRNAHDQTGILREQVARTAGSLTTLSFGTDDSAMRQTPVVFHPQSVQDLLRQAPSLNMELISDILPRLSSGPDSTILDRVQRFNAILGERFVFSMLLGMLGDSFGPDNWTSEARGVVGGFSPFEGDSLGDFTYHDFDGTLTKIWCHSEAWVESGRPRYHIEVKSTAGTAQEPFQMSRHQLDIASNLAAHEGTCEVPTDVYVLIRVWGVRNPTSMSYAVYVDPFKRIWDGELKLVSDSVDLMISGLYS